MRPKEQDAVAGDDRALSSCPTSALVVFEGGGRAADVATTPTLTRSNCSTQSIISLGQHEGAPQSTRATQTHGSRSSIHGNGRLAGRFKRVLEESTGRHYYYDKETRKTFWTLAEGRASCTPQIAPSDPRRRQKTYGVPPTDVEAVGHDQAALVWWKPSGSDAQTATGERREASESRVLPRDPGRSPEPRPDAVERDLLRGESEATAHCTIGFVVHRYRLDGDQWHKKGSTSVAGAKAKSVRVNGLQNGLVYRFTVSCKTQQGDSMESEPSHTVRPNKSLPAGWKEIFHTVTGKPVYKNDKTGQTSSTRPEYNPFFVDTDLFVKFTPEEMDRLFEEYRVKAEIQNSTCVTVDDIVNVLPRLGEKLRQAEVVKRLEELGWEGASGPENVPTVGYRQFIALMWSIKGSNMKRTSALRRLWDGLATRIAPKRVPMKLLALMEHDPGKRMGTWDKLLHPVIRRAYYVNRNTGHTSWTMPAEVRFFLNDRLKEDLLTTTFSEQELLGLRKSFAKMDLDADGTIDHHELSIVLRSFGEAVPLARLKALIREVNRDGSGQVDFEEFAVVMQSVKQGKASLSWGRIHRHLQADGQKFNELADEYRSNKERRNKRNIGEMVSSAPHTKYCLCGCRAIEVQVHRDKTIYKDWGTRKGPLPDRWSRNPG